MPEPENYYNPDKRIFHPDTPIDYFVGIVPFDVLKYCAKYNRKTLKQIHHTLRNVFQALTSKNKDVLDICDEALNEMSLEKNSFDNIFSVVSSLLGEEYIKEQALAEFQRAPYGKEEKK